MQGFARLVVINIPEILDHVFVRLSPIQDRIQRSSTATSLLLSISQIIGAASYFPTIWSWIKKWVDPHTVKKFHILHPSEVLSTFQQYLDTESIATTFGGDVEYEHGMRPRLDVEVEEVWKWLSPNASLPMGPLKWVDQGKRGRVVVAVGNSEGGKEKKVGGLQSGAKTCA